MAKQLPTSEMLFVFHFLFARLRLQTAVRNPSLLCCGFLLQRHLWSQTKQAVMSSAATDAVKSLAESGTGLQRQTQNSRLVISSCLVPTCCLESVKSSCVK